MEKLLWIAALWPMAACAVHGWELVASRRRVGAVLHAEAGPLIWTALYALAGAAFCVFAAQSSPALPASILVGLACAAVLLSRRQRGQACGEAGVQRGCFSCAYEDVEEWRLTGDHLRFRVGEVWRAVSLPSALHPELRGVLEGRAEGLESRFAK